MHSCFVKHIHGCWFPLLILGSTTHEFEGTVSPKTRRQHCPCSRMKRDGPDSFVSRFLPAGPYAPFFSVAASSRDRKRHSFPLCIPWSRLSRRKDPVLRHSNLFLDPRNPIQWYPEAQKRVNWTALLHIARSGWRIDSIGEKKRIQTAAGVAVVLVTIVKQCASPNGMTRNTPYSVESWIGMPPSVCSSSSSSSLWVCVCVCVLLAS